MQNIQRAVKVVNGYPLVLSPYLVLKTLLHQKTSTRLPVLSQPEVSPFGQVGDYLWVREGWCVAKDFDSISLKRISPHTPVSYPADYIGLNLPSHLGKIRPAQYMPYWASRISLQILNIAVERLQAITSTQAALEGYRCQTPCRRSDCDGCPSNSIALFRKDWDLRYSEQDLRWDADPQVWVCSFKITRVQRVA